MKAVAAIIDELREMTTIFLYIIYMSMTSVHQ